jgi:hypothetical protein
MNKITESKIQNSPSNSLKSRVTSVSTPSPTNYAELNDHE